MTAKDRFSITLGCKTCGSKGVANLYQEDGWSFTNGDQSTYLDTITDGFKVMSLKNSKFLCLKCNEVV